MNGDEIDAYLRELAEPDFREFTCKLMPGTDNVLGVRVPELRKIAKQISKGDWREFLGYPSKTFEHTMVRAFVIATAPMDMDERLSLTDRFIPEVTNWAINDSFCNSWKIGTKDDPEKLWDYCLALVDRHEEFPSRVGAVMMMTHFIDEAHIDKMLDKLVSCPRCGYYLDMGIAWALSFCYIRFPEKTEQAIFDGRLEYEVLNMTVRKIRDSFRVSKEDKDRLKDRLKGLTRRSS